ncbi:Bifunctional protein FolD (Includes: Methylenetetrahydrofolate dehydrogenase; Methenyltetrahydrofolate cyclohydrolase) [Candidatus Zixiibacteriota bacterium]|nr:Bifunctional protein FolD (Includes: Methylenetetrahydrofolate dehydrogenase; Methenyltetrahydrofolate cyclohydrolase) [candidate division Zixibacteria bacterium]
MRQLTAVVIDGKMISDQIKSELKSKVESLKSEGIIPGLAAVLVGNNPASESYVNGKAKACEKVGIYSEVIRRPAEITQAELEKIVTDLNRRGDIDGILVQSPLPDHIDELTVTLTINPHKDVDGFHPHSVGMLLLGRPTFRSCTPYGVIELLRRYKIDTSGKEIVILGRSNIVGKPLAAMLIQKAETADATVTVCHSRTKNLKDHCRRADILIAAMGRPEFVTADMIKDNAVVIDVGINRVDDPAKEKGYRLTGDVDYSGCREKASFITPVPGGVGPMTIAMLLTNTVHSAEQRRSRLK